MNGKVGVDMLKVILYMGMKMACFVWILSCVKSGPIYFFLSGLVVNFLWGNHDASLFISIVGLILVKIL